mgnify:CR=1 FL=1
MPDSTKSFNPDRIKKNKTAKRKPKEQAFDAQKKPPATLQTASGIPLKSVYTPEDVSDLDYDRQIGLPGQEPFVRGVYPSMYRGRSWTLRENGPPETRVDVLVLGDGYTEGEFEDFRSDAERLVEVRAGALKVAGRDNPV